MQDATPRLYCDPTLVLPPAVPDVKEMFVQINRFTFVVVILLGASTFGCAELEQDRRPQARTNESTNQPDPSGEGESIPVPKSWAFPKVVDSARAISPTNVEGKRFNRMGLVYTEDELAKLKLSSMSAEELARYADIVTHAYPDAVARELPPTCDDLPVEQLNETAIAGLGYISIHARSADTRNKASGCLAAVQKKLSQQGR